jgi:hypothetical protein
MLLAYGCSSGGTADRDYKAISDEPIEYEIRTVFEWRDSFTDGTKSLFVYEYPYFSGNDDIAGKWNAIYEDIMLANDHADEGDEHNYQDFVRIQDSYTFGDYINELAPDIAEDVFYDITLCSIYESEYAISVSQQGGWFMGGIHDTGYVNRTFEPLTGDEILITDILQGSIEEIHSMLQEEFAREYDELNEESDGSVNYFLGESGIYYAPDNIFGFQRGCLLLVPYSRQGVVKQPFYAEKAQQEVQYESLLGEWEFLDDRGNGGEFLFTLVFTEPDSVEYTAGWYLSEIAACYTGRFTVETEGIVSLSLESDDPDGSDFDTINMDLEYTVNGNYMAIKKLSGDSLSVYYGIGDTMNFVRTYYD